jgi:hypothetical protein
VELEDFYTGNYIPFRKVLRDSYYWKYMLSPNEKIVLPALWESAIIDTKYHTNGLLLANIKYRTILDKIGSMTYSTLKKTISRLDRTGALIKLDRNRFRNNKYFLGFRHRVGSERIYLLYHLILKYEESLGENIENQKSAFTKDWQRPIIDYRPYCLNHDYRTFILDCIEQPNTLLNKRILGDKTLTDLLFGHSRHIYKKPLPKVMP